MSDLFDTLAARATGAVPEGVGIARARPVARFEPAITDEQADPIEVDAEVSALSARVRPQAVPVEAVIPAARPDAAPPARPSRPRPTSRLPVAEAVRAERHGPGPAAVPLGDSADPSAVEAAAIFASLPYLAVAATRDPSEAETPTMPAAVRAEPGAADPPNLATTAVMADAPAEASGEPAAPSAAIPVAPPPVRGRIEREVSVSIGRVVVEWIDRPATEIPAITRPPAPARARGFTGIAAAWRGVLR